MSGTDLLGLFAVLVAVAVVVAVVVTRVSGPRPDAPLKDVDDAGRGGRPNERSAATLDRPGGPGQEPANPEPGDAVPGPEGHDSA